MVNREQELRSLNTELATEKGSHESKTRLLATEKANHESKSRLLAKARDEIHTLKVSGI